MKFSISILISILFTLSSKGQPNAIDSLEKTLAGLKEDTNKVNALNLISIYYDESNSDRSIEYEKRALNLSTKLNYKKGEVRAVSHLGFLAMTEGNYPTALELLFQAKSYNDTDPVNPLTLDINQNIGLTYFYMGDFKKAIGWLLKARAVSIILNSDEDDFFTRLNLGRTYLKLNDLDSALFYASEAYRRNTRINSLYGRAAILLTLGEIHEKLGQENIGFQFYKQAIPAAMNENGKRVLIRSYQSIANFYLKKGNADSALLYGIKAVSESKKAGYTQHLMESSALVSSIYNKHHQYDSAFFYLSTSTSSREEMYSQEKQSAIQNLIFSETLRDLKETQNKQQAEIQRKKNLQNIFIAMGLTVFVVLFLLISRSIIVNERLIKFFGVIGLLMMFEFLNLLMHPLLERITHHSPFLMLLGMVAIGALLIPLHHNIEKVVVKKMVEKNKEIRLTSARKTIDELEKADSSS